MRNKLQIINCAIENGCHSERRAIARSRRIRLLFGERILRRGFALLRMTERDGFPVPREAKRLPYNYPLSIASINFPKTGSKAAPYQWFSRVAV